MDAQDFFHDLVFSPVDIWNSGVADGIGIDVNTLRDYIHLLDSYSINKITRLDSEDMALIKSTIDKYNDKGVNIEYVTKKISGGSFKNKNISLQGKIVVGIDFSGCDFNEAYISNCSFYGCEFNNCDFTSTTINSNCFYNCSFSDNKFEKSFITRTRFVNTNITSQELKSVIINDSGIIDSIGHGFVLNKCVVNGTYFNELMNDVNIKSCRFIDCYFSHVASIELISNTRLESCVFNHVDMSNCKIKNVDKTACIFKNTAIDNKNFPLIDKSVEYASPAFLEFENEFGF